MARTELVKFRVTENEKKLILKAAEIVGLSISDFMRERILETSRSIILVSEERITEQKMIDMENVKATYLSREAATADLPDE